MKSLPRAQNGPVVIDRDVWNYLCELVERSANLSAAYPLQLLVGGAGSVISLLDGAIEAFIAVVTDHGPAAEANYTNERYWVRRSFVDGADSETLAQATPTTHVTTSYWNKDNGDPYIVTATNLFEGSLDKEEAGLDSYQSGTHLLAKGMRVLVLGLRDRADQTNVRYFIFPLTPARVVEGFISSAATDGGVYNAKIIKFESDQDFDPADASTLDDDMPAEDNAFFINRSEEGLATHDLTEGTPQIRKFIGIIRPRKSIKVNSSGVADPNGTQRFVVVGWALDLSNCAAVPNAPLHV